MSCISVSRGEPLLLLLENCASICFAFFSRRELREEREDRAFEAVLLREEADDMGRSVGR